MDRHLAMLRDARARGESITVVHYACENLHTATDHPPAVSAIAVHSLGDGVTQQFSRTESPAGTAASVAETALLERFFSFVQNTAGTRFVHWKMSHAQYGFEALVARYRYLAGSEPVSNVPQSARYDLGDLVEAEYGEDYATHPKMATLAQLNGIHPRYALAGAEEADRFEQRDFGAIDRSTAEKATWIARLCRLLLAGELETLTSAGKLNFAGGDVDAVAIVRQLGDRLIYVQREILDRHADRQTMSFDDEYDDQDLFRGLLRIFFDDVRPENYVPEYAGASSRVDFVLPEFGIAVELKHCHESHTAKKIGDELIIDAKRYAALQDVRHLVCLVMDYSGRLANPRGLEHDLATRSTQDGLAVSVAIIDR